MSNNGNGNNTGLVPFGRSSAHFADFVKDHRAELRQVAASTVDVPRLYRVVLGCVSRTPALQKCTILSLFRAMTQAAELGLEPSSALGECYLVPFKDQAQLIIGYRGLITLARRSGEVESIQAFCVYEGDEFDVMLGNNPVLMHKPSYQCQDPEKILYAYAIARLKGGISQFDVMSRAEIERIRVRSRAGNDGPWKTDYAEMAKKTVTRRLVKYLPMSIEMAKAVEVTDANEFGDLEIIDIPVGPETPVDPDITEAADLSSLDVAPVSQSAQAAGR